MIRNAWIFALFFLVGCATPSQHVPTGRAPAASPTATGLDVRTQIVMPVERKIVRDAELALYVKHVDEAVASVRQIVGTAQGYIVNIELSGTEQREARIQVKVPAAALDDTLGKLAGLGRERRRAENARDVTEEYVDLETRLKTLQVEEQRLLDLVKQTGNVKDLLEVEKELSRVRGDIEQRTGRLKLLDHQVQYSSIAIELQQPSAAVPITFWNLGQTVEDAWSTLLILVRFGAQCVIYLAVLFPLWAPIVWLWWVKHRRKAARHD